MAFGQVQNFAEIKSVGLGTGKFDANSDRVILLATIEMFTWDNPVYLNTITHAGSFVTRSVIIGIQPDDNLLDGYQYSIQFEWTATQLEPLVKVTRSTNSTLEATIYEPQLGFRDNQYWVAVPVTVFEGVSTGSHWFAFSLTNFFTDDPITTSSATDKCEGGIF